MGGDPVIRVLQEKSRWEISSLGVVRVRVTMDGPRGHPEAPPDRIHLQGEDEASADLELKDFTPSPPGEDLFSLEPPASFRDASADPASPAPWREAS